jgi:hypothetical protein
MLLDHSEAAHRLAILHENYMFEFNGDLLEGAERVYVVVWRFQMEAYNGGIWQFFSNSSGAFAPYLCESLTEIGAPQVADIAERAIAAAKPGTSWDAALQKSAALNLAPDDVQRQAHALDDELSPYLDKLSILLFNYLAEHPEPFDQPPEFWKVNLQ